MQGREEKILARELGKIGGLGAMWVAKRLPTETHEATLTLPCSAQTTNQIVRQTLETLGRISDDFPVVTVGQVSAIIGSGSMNLNPTIVHVVVTATSEMGTQVNIRAIAKEGMMKQNSAAKAVGRVQDQLIMYSEQMGRDEP